MQHLNTPWKSNRATMQPPPFPIGRNSCPNATILTLPSSCFLPGTTRRCYHPNASIRMSASHHCHPVATTPPLPSQCYWSNVSISMISSWQYLPDAHSPMTSQCYHPDANVLMQSSWHYHPDATISKKQKHYCLILPTWHFYLDATFSMP